MQRETGPSRISSVSRYGESLSPMGTALPSKRDMASQLDQARKSLGDERGKPMVEEYEVKGRVSASAELTEAARQTYIGLHPGLTGLGRKPDQILDALSQRSPAELKEIFRIYRDNYRENLSDELSKKLSKKEKQQFLSICAGDSAAADVIAIRRSMSKLNMGGPQIIKILERQTPESLEKLKEAYNLNTSSDLLQDLRKRLYGNNLDAAKRLLDPESPRPKGHNIGTYETAHGHDHKLMAIDLKALLLKKRPDTDAIVAIVSKLTKDELNDFKRTYASCDVLPLEQRINSSLSGRSKVLTLLHLQGAPETPEEKISTLKKEVEIQQTGVAGFVAKLSPKGRILQQTIHRAEDVLKKAKADGVISPYEEARIGELTNQYGHANAKTCVELEDKISDRMGTITAAIAGSAVAAASGGLALGPVIALSAFAGSVGHPIGQAIGKGKAYEKSDVLPGMAKGAVEGALSGVTTFEAAQLSQPFDKIIDNTAGPSAKLMMSVSSANLPSK